MKHQATKLKKTKQTTANDLLLPILAVLCLLPFTVYLAEYDDGFSDYLWHSDYSILQDFYTYYRQIFFLVIVAFAVIILAFRLPLYKEHTKNWKIFYPLIGYSVLVLLSSIFSIHRNASWLAEGVTLENAFVLIGYGLIAFYTYQIMTQSDYSAILRGIYIMFVPMSIIGWFQVFQHDLLNYEWVQKILMPEHLFEEYGGMVENIFTGNNVFLTLYNPNFAAVFLVMFICVFFVLTIYAPNRKYFLLNGIFLLDALILCWFTYTRAALVGLLVSFLAFLFCIRKSPKIRLVKFILPAMVLIFGVFFLYDGLHGGKYIHRLLDAEKETGIDAMLTTERGVEITYEGSLYILSFSEDETEICLKDSTGNTIETEYNENGDMILPFTDEAYAMFLDFNEMPNIFLYLEDTTLQFTIADGMYYYCTDWGKMDRMTSIAHVDFGGLESLGSGRVYIWSRIIPILPKYLFIGSGPDTFAEAFPQNDYVGKMVYSEYTGRIIERAHNDYLMHWVQTGFLSLVCLLVFYAWFLKKGFGFYQNNTMEHTSDKIGFGCFLGCIGYLACGMFSDSTLYTTPTFYVFIGLTLASTMFSSNGQS